MPRIRIDGSEYEVDAGANLLETSLSLGLDLPYFCWHPAMGSIGACRQCAVVQYRDEAAERSGLGRLVMACMTPVSDGAIFSMHGDKARAFRESVVESLMLNHPHDCPVCAEGGECHLQDMTVMVGHRDRHYRGRKRTYRNQYLGPLLNHEMNRCITCYRCTRFYRDYAGGTDLAALGSKNHVYFGRQEEGVLESEFAGNLVEVCPTGVFTDKNLVHDYTRKWDLQSAPSICTGCAVGCNTLPGERYGRLKRVHNRFNERVNGYFLCDRGRFGAAFVNSERRLRFPGRRETDGRYAAVDHHQALQYMLDALAGKKTAGIGSPRASVESNYLLRALVGAPNYAPGFSCTEQRLALEVLRLQETSAATIPDLPGIESADAVLVLGEDPTHSAPRIALALRQSVRNRAGALAAELGLETWQDAAIRNLAQEELSPLFIATVAESRLDDVAAASLSLAPDDIAALGHAVADAIAAGSVDAPSGTAGDIARALSAAERPLVLSGMACGSIEVVRAAARVADALCTTGRRAALCLTLPEANSLGQAMLAGPEAPDLEQLAQRAAAGELDTLVVLENDLYRRGSRELIDRLLGAFTEVLVLDSLDNRTTSAASLALPAASFAESEGTLVSLEGRAQRYFPVFIPQDECRPSWIWLLACMKELELAAARDLHLFDDITRACAEAVPRLRDITAAAPDHLFRNAGLRVPRQPHRYSGRTAMHADVNVHEPRRPADEESPLAYSMEGLNRSQPGALLPYVWAPGWNSNQSIHRFQAEVGGALKGGTAGVRLLAGGSGIEATGPFRAAEPVAGCWTLVPRPHIFGSEELSALSPCIAALTGPAVIELSPTDAATLGVSSGDGVNVDTGANLEVRVNERIARGCAGFSAGFPGTEELQPLRAVRLCRAGEWRRDPELIGTDKDGGEAA